MDKHNEQILLHIYAHCLDVESFIKRFGNSIEDFKKALAFDEDNSIILYNLGCLYASINDYAQAIPYYNRVDHSPGSGA